MQINTLIELFNAKRYIYQITNWQINNCGQNMPRKSVQIHESLATKVQGQLNMTTNEKVYEWYIPYMF